MALLEIRGRKLRKVGNVYREAKIGGVCAGVAYWLGIPVWLVRVVWILLLFAYGVGLGVYFVLWIALPTWEELPVDFHEITGD